MTTYIFAIGGTGSRVLRSLTMLLASGCGGTSTKDEIIPIIIDYDTTNGDTDRAQKVLEQYEALHKTIYRTGDVYNEHFFCSPLIKIKEKLTQSRFGGGVTFDPKSRFEIHLDTSETDITFADFLKLRSMGNSNGTLPTRHLLEALYDNSDKDNPRAELNLNLNKGFKGCPNIGCIVTRRLERSPEYQNFQSNFRETTDRILIIGSVFGGTGASGIPMLLDLIRENPSWQSVPVGVVAMMPYFKVSEDPNSAISTSTFKAKAKAAMTAYDLNNSVNYQATAIYYVGDNDMSQPFPNHEGGKEQENKALFPELVAAMFAIDFIKKPADVWNNRGDKAIAFEFGMTDDAPISLPTMEAATNDNSVNATAICPKHFFDAETNQPYLDSLSRFVLFAKFCKDYLAKEKEQKKDLWLLNSGLKENTSFKIALDQFADELFNWLDELAGPQRPLKLYHPKKEGYLDLFEGRILVKKRKYYWDLKAFDESDILDALNSYFKIASTELQERSAMMFIKNSHDAFNDIFNKIIKFK